ncbi:Glycosyl transferase, group 2 family protein [Acidisarcina polymorpha]|uniref:Glycosyl transferase, group 2 family protein n=1 Tax=Acidisarcina polymorpha TaxID=2211140 RepID=A0A2Z5FTX0_9BACT|nr:glycosyltransferase [Acidisarcina polymorpha]AXC10142.1 Glycosyl transferase, group 2 family protein [Acidisarcina polymorpha]
MKNDSVIPIVSVVVIGRNEGPRLQRCLESVRDMEKPGGDFEIIYVDSSSTDNSPDLARRLGALVISIDSSRPTAALGRNVGWRASSGSFVLFLDGDTILHPEFVVQSLQQFGSDTAIVFGNRREIHPEASVYNRVLDLEWISASGFVDSCGGDALMRRAALEAVQGYDENLIAGEEPEMCRRLRELGWKILHVDGPMTGHDLAISQWSQYCRRAMRTGYAYAQVSERFRGSSLPFWKVEARHNRNVAFAHASIITLSVLASLIWRTAWPIGLVLAFFLLLALRTAGRVTWKSNNLATRLLYGIHSHLQQIPIYLGQLQYWSDRRKGLARGLIEYKGTSQ